MGTLLTQLIPLALGAAISPVLLVAVLFILSSNHRPAARASAFLVGSAAVLAIIAVVFLDVFKRISHVAAGASPTDSIVDFVLGVLLLSLGVGKIVEYLRSRGATDSPPPAKSSDDADSLLAAKRASGGLVSASFLGVALMASNVTTLALYLAALKVISSADVTVTDQVFSVTMVAVIALFTVWFPILLTVVMPATSRRVLGAMNAFVAAHRALITGIFCLVFGLYLVLKAT
ncbi:MAG: GAP family protein [Actinomycetes bacterium]